MDTSHVLTWSYDDFTDRDWRKIYEDRAMADTSNAYWPEWSTKTPAERRAFGDAVLAVLAQHYENTHNA